MRLLVSFAAFLFLVALVVTGSGRSGAQEGSCPPGTLPAPGTGECVAVTDRTGAGEFGPYDGPLPPEPSAVLDGSGAAAAGVGVPEPQGNLAAGVTYKRYRLDASEGAELMTGMEVYPEGLGLDLGPHWIFTTATNRVEKFQEVVGYYTRAGSGGLGVFDTSCSPEYPCRKPLTGEVTTGPDWVWNQYLRDLPCYYQFGNPFWLGGDWLRTLFYRNKAEKLDSGSPPLWRNSVQVFNFCTWRWDMIYAHEYRVNQRNCAVEDCAWWGPIIETVPRSWDPGSAPISELGFQESKLYLAKAGEPSGLLSPEDTDWHKGPSLWQMVAHLLPNHSWGRGTYLDSDADGVWDFQDPDDDQDGYTDEVEAGAPLCVGSANDDSFDDAGVNDGCPAVGAPEIVCLAAYDEDGDGRVNDGCPQVGSWSEGQFKIGTMSVGRCSYNTTPPSRAWPSEFIWSSAQDYLRIDISDVLTFITPVYRLWTKPGDPGFDSRWDLVPGSGADNWINITDLLALLAGPSGYPPMLNGQPAFMGPRCPW